MRLLVAGLADGEIDLGQIKRVQVSLVTRSLGTLNLLEAAHLL